MSNQPPKDSIYPNEWVRHGLASSDQDDHTDPDAHPELYPEMNPDFFDDDLSSGSILETADDSFADTIVDFIVPNQTEIQAALSQLRKKMLDLTAHNPLISYVHGRSSRYIRITDELPNKLVEHLFNGKHLSFSPVPAPDLEELANWKAEKGTTTEKRPPAIEWAARCGIDASCDLPDVETAGNKRKFQNLRIQTPYYPDVLESRLAGIMKLSRTTIEETGTNFLHMAVGFLEWYESDDSEKPRYAPLYIVPVSLERGTIDKTTNTYQYTLSLSGEDLQFNASLAARLNDDFSFVLPELDVSKWPDEYLDKVAKKVSRKYPRWKVRRWSTIALFNFGRLLMYRDLDPANWPAGKSLDTHELVTSVIAGESRAHVDATANIHSSTEHAIDEIADIHKRYPLVDVADSSQHSALIDALDGRNLVIQGPPGTGKSQTITNLIGAALNQGKTVLFVSEKMAALDVVRQRMHRLNLDDFCLELHSHTTHKIGVIESLRQRISAKFPPPSALDDQIQYHSELRDRLQQHALLVNKAWKNTGKTIHEILTSAARLRQELPEELTSIRIESIDGELWDPMKHAVLQRELRAFHRQVQEVAGDIGSRDILSEHPWRGVTSTELDAKSCEEVVTLLADWNRSLQGLLEHARNLAVGSGTITHPVTKSEIRKLAEAATRLPSTANPVFWEALVPLRDPKLAELDGILTIIGQLQDRALRTGALNFEDLLEFVGLSNLSEAISTLLASGLPSNFWVEDLPRLQDASESIQSDTANLYGHLREFAEQEEGALPSFLIPEQLSLASLKILSSVVKTASLLPVELLHCRSDALRPYKLGTKFSEFSAILADLRQARSRLSLKFSLDAARTFPMLAEFAQQVPPMPLIKRLLNSNYRKAKLALIPVMLDPKRGWDCQRIQAELLEIVDYFNCVTSFEEDSTWKQLFGDVFAGMSTDLASLQKLVQWHSTLDEKFCVVVGKLFREQKLTDAGVWLLEAPAELIEKLPAFTEAGLQKRITSIEQNLIRVPLAYGHAETPEAALLSEDGDSWVKIFRMLVDTVPRLANLNFVLKPKHRATLAEARDTLEEYASILRDWYEAEVHYAALNEHVFSGELPSNPLPTQIITDMLKPTRDWWLWLIDDATPVRLTELIESACNGKHAERIRQWGTTATRLLSIEAMAHKTFSKASNVEATSWSPGKSLPHLIERANEALAAPDLLTAFTGFLRLRGMLRTAGLTALSDEMERAFLPVAKYAMAYEHAVAASLAEEILRKEIKLRRFDGMSQTEAQRDFSECDQKILELMRRRIAARISKRGVPQGHRGARVSEHTERELLNNEISKQTRHIPIRQLLRRAGNAVQALKPCFLMGPRSVAQYLAPDGLRFDLLIIDEASQMRPADALGAVARCSQLVVVGDSKQLAPTSFFDRLDGSDESEDEQFEMSVSQSILDAVAPIFKSRQLRWHYRSRHESLIAFSNLEFYKNNLMLFPSPHLENEELGVKFIHVADGIFENQTNQPEATLIVARVEKLLTEKPGLSLGVATMNAKQRDLIDRMLEDRAKRNPFFGDALAENAGENESLFVKNLENVQGDEREVILISCTYGRDLRSGKLYQRFGPINSPDGWRRLNVLFTRSRTRMEIFSSMESTDIAVDEKSSAGVKALRGMLHYAETKKLKIEGATDREPDSDFEIAVANMLEAHGFEADCQVGVAGFFIDLAVKDPTRPGKYLMGIECDGATYHSAKSVRDRDRLRQEVLEGMDWVIRRIWSTDWFANPQRALRPLLKELMNSASAETLPTTHENEVAD